MSNIRVTKFGNVAGVPADIQQAIDQSIAAATADSVKNSNDNDIDPQNEIQVLAISGADLSISKSNSVNLSKISTRWKSYENVIVFTNGNVGIGTDSLVRSLQVKDVIRLEPRNTSPSDPSEGDIYMDGNSHKLKVFNGTEWKECW